MPDCILYHAKFYGIPCWFLDNGDNVLVGKNRFYDRLIPVAAAIHNGLTFLMRSPAVPFPIELVREATEHEIENLTILPRGMD